MHFKLTTLSGNTTIKVDVDPSTAMGALIRLIEMAFKAEIRGKGQVEERLDFHVNALFCSCGHKNAKMVENMRTSQHTVEEHFDETVAATVMIAKTLCDGDEEAEDGQSLFDWSKGAPPAAGSKRGAANSSGGVAKKAKASSDGAQPDTETEQSVLVAELTFFSLEDNVRLVLPLARAEDGSVEFATLIQRLEAAYVDNRRAATANDAFGLWEGDRPIEVTSLIFFGLKNRPAGSFVRTIASPFPAKLLPPTAEAPEAAELGTPMDLQEGDYVAFRFKRHTRAAQTVSAFPQGFVRSMNALATMGADDGAKAKLGAGRGEASAPFLETAKELVLNKLKGHPQLLKVWQATFTVSAEGEVVVLDPASKAGEAEEGQVALSNCCSGPWRVGTMCTKFGRPTQILDSVVACHEEYENVNGLSALIKKKGSSGWKKAGEVKVSSSFAGIFDKKELKAPGAGEDGSGPGAYPKLSWQPIAIVPEGTYGQRPNDNEVFPVYTKDRGGKLQAIKIMFLSGNDYK